MTPAVNFGPAPLFAGPTAVVQPAPAKVNLFLELVRFRPDGFRDLDTVFLAVDLADTVEVIDDPGGGLSLECDAAGVPSGPGNLAYEAAAKLKERFAPTRGTRIRLTKRIPAQAGLGGGSSDAAATLLALNRLWGLELSRADLAAVGRELGSDVGFFLGLNSPAARGIGRGDELTDVPVTGRVHLLLAKPAAGCPTPEVYKRSVVPADPKSSAACIAALAAGDADRLAAEIFNRLGDPAFAVAPAVKAVFETVDSALPGRALVSGSGSCVFGLARDASDAARAAQIVRGTLPPSAGPTQLFLTRSWPVPPEHHPV